MNTRTSSRLLAAMWITTLLSLAVLGAAPTAAPTSATATASAPASLVPPVLPADRTGPKAVECYRKLVTDLASPAADGRFPGTPGITVARDYILQTWKNAGLKPACSGNYLQAFDVRTGSRVKQQTLELLDESGKVLTAAKPGTTALAAGFSPSGKFDGPAVFAGYGIRSATHSYDSYADVAKDALKGKVVVVFRYEPQKAGKSAWTGGNWSAEASLHFKASWAADRGAAALLVVNPPTSADSGPIAGGSMGIPPAVIPTMQIGPDVLKKMLAAAGQTDADAVAKLQQQADEHPAVTDLPKLRVRGQVEQEETNATTYNIAVVVPGAGELAKQYIVVGGHYDHIGRGYFASRGGFAGQLHPGADDNASGASGVVMLAKWFADRAAAADAPANRRTLIFTCFSGEELGLLGSRFMTEHLDQLGIAAKDIDMMVNLDMIGRLREDDVLVWGAASGEGLVKLVDQAAAGTKFKLHHSGAGEGPSDFASFFHAGVPVVNFTTGLEGEYHRPTDTADKINCPGAIEVLGLTADVISRRWTAGDKLAFVKSAQGEHGYLGVVPDISEESGCRISAVLPNSAAEKAGLRAGDVITKLDGKAIASTDALMDAMSKTKADQKLTLQIAREGKTMDVTVQLLGE